jgi:tetratricopeptide (TPR) repeat protein
MTTSTTPIVSTSTVPKRLDKYDIEKHVDEFVVVWLKEGDLNSDTEFELRQVINYIRVYQNEQDCLKYIRINSKEKIFLILSDSIAEKFVPKIHDFNQIQFIYIFCEYFPRFFISNSMIKIEKHREWIKNYLKIVDVYDNKSKLFSKVQENAHLLSISTIPMTIFNLSSDEKSIREFNKESATFMWFYLIIEILLRMSDKSTSKIEMINECRLCYENDLIEQEKIKDFDVNYSTDEAISWYTRDSFLYRTLNKALRTENIDIIFKFRFFLSDLFNQLKLLHNEFMEILDDIILTVYRGGCVSVNELENLKTNIGGFISFNTFLSTSLDKDVALLFAGQGDNRPLRESILFQIKIFTQSNLKPFANIKEKSFMKDEDEILFSLGTIFRIESVECLNQYIWIINLTLSGDEDLQIQNLRQYFQEKLDQILSINDLGDFLYKIGDYHRAQCYYRILLNKYPSDHRDLVMIYCNMGVLEHCQDNYREASNYFTTALLLLSNSLLSMNDRDHTDLATINYNLGCSIAKFEGYRVAIWSFKRALDHFNKYIRTSHPSLINMYNGYALANADSSLFGIAIFYHRVALTIVEKTTPVNQIDLANTYYSMGLTYKLMKDYSQALDFFQKCLNIRKLCLPENHPDLADVFNDMAHIYNHQRHYELTLQTYEKVLEIYRKSHYSRMTMVYVDIGNAHRNNANYQEAIDNYKKALEIIETNPAEYCNDLTQVYMNIGLYYECQYSYSDALLYLEKAVSTVKDTWSKVQLNLAIIYNHIGLIHYKNKNQQLAMENLQKCLDIRLKFLPSTHSDVIATYTDINQVNELEQTLWSHLKETTGMKDFDNIHEHCNSDDHQVLDLRVIKRLENE